MMHRLLKKPVFQIFFIMRCSEVEQYKTGYHFLALDTVLQTPRPFSNE